MKVNRLISALLCLVLVLGILPVSASAAGKITHVRVEDIGIPIDYETLKTDYTVPYNTEYEKDSYYSTVRWTKKDGITETTVAPGHMVQPGATYCAYITLHSKDDTKPFDPSVNCDLNFVYGDGKKVGDKYTDRKLTLRRDNMELEIKLTFPAITIYDYTYELTNKPGKTHGMPKVGEHPWSADDICSAIQESQLSTILATWYKVQGGSTVTVNSYHSFEKNTKYILELEIRDGPGAIIETGTSIIYYDDYTGLFLEGKINSSNKVSYLFTPIDPLIPEAVINGFTYPTVGATVESATNAWPGADTFEMVSQEWYRVNTLLSPSETFTAPASYRCALTIRPRSGYKFDSTTTVKVRDYGGNEIGITSTTLLTDGSLRIWTESIPISAKVDTVYADSFIPPVAGRSIAEAYPAIYNSTANITENYWLVKNSAGYERVDSGVFEAGKTYYLALVIKPKSGYTFDASTKVYVRYGDQSELPVKLDYCSYNSSLDQFLVYTEDLVCKEPIDEVTITGFEYPVVGEMSGMPAIYLKKPDGSNYGFYDAYWYEDGVRIKSTDRFQEGKTYELYVRLSADDGYTFYSSDSYKPLYGYTKLYDNCGKLVPLQWTGAMYKAIGFEPGTLDWKFYTEPMYPTKRIDSVRFDLDNPVDGQPGDYSPAFPVGVHYNSGKEMDLEDPEYYKNNIMWDYTPVGSNLYGDSHFFHMVLNADPGYSFNPDLDSLSITYNGFDIHGYNYSAELLDKDRLSLWITPGTVIARADISIQKPVAGSHPDQHPTCDADAPYKVTLDSWYLNESPYPYLQPSGTFEPFKRYALRLIVTPDIGYFLDESSEIYLNGVKVTDRFAADYGCVQAYLSVTTPNPFVDVPDGSWFYNAVLWAYYHDPQITTGSSATTFSPNRNCTRGEVVTFLWRAHGKEAPASTVNPFTDVMNGKWYTDAVLWAANHTPLITNGIGGGRFGLNNICTRAEVVTFLWRAAGCPDPISQENPFNDVPDGQWYTKAILWAVEQGITNGNGKGGFSPTVPCSRSQIVTFLYRYMEG